MLRTSTYRVLGRVALVTGLGMMGFGAAAQFGLFTASNLTATIGVVGLPVAGGPALFDLLTRRATFVVEIAQADPGEYILRGPSFDEWVRAEVAKYPVPAGAMEAVIGLAVAEPPRTVPSRSPDGRYTRLPIVVLNAAGAFGGTVAGQVKFLTLKVRVRWADATDCKAVVAANLLRGEEGVLQKGKWIEIGEANWHSDQKVSGLYSPTVGPAAIQSAKELRLLAEWPELLLEHYLGNPRADIIRGEWAYLPLAYMREGSKFLYFNGGRPGTALARVSPETGPIEVQFQVKLLGQHADEGIAFLKARADWNAVSLEMFEPTRTDLQ